LMFQQGVYSFASMELNRTHLTTSWISDQGEVLYRHSQTPRAKRALSSAVAEAVSWQVPSELTEVRRSVAQEFGRTLLAAFSTVIGCGLLCAAVFVLPRKLGTPRQARDYTEMENLSLGKGTVGHSPLA
ncbi:unnamed protein product, partial [Polarella glacialis]